MPGETYHIDRAHQQGFTTLGVGKRYSEADLKAFDEAYPVISLDADPLFGIRGKERLTPRLDAASQRVLQSARQEAIRFNHHYLGTEHILLGLIQDPDSQRIAERIGLTAPRVRDALEFIIGKDTERPQLGSTDELDLTPRGKAILRHANNVKELTSNLKVIAVPHLWEGVILEGEGIASGIIESLGVHPEGIRATLGTEAIKKRQEIAYRALIEEKLIKLKDPTTPSNKKQTAIDMLKQLKDFLTDQQSS